MNRKSFVLTPRPPFRLDLTVWTLRRRPDNLIDRWDGQVYRRMVVLPGGPTEFAVQQVAPPLTPKLKVTVEGKSLSADTKELVSSILQRLLGLDKDLTKFYAFAARETRLDALAMRFYGMKPPRFASVFEGIINAIACQQLTLTVGIELLNRLAKACGAESRGQDAIANAFPRAEDLIKVSPMKLRALGFSRQKGRAMLELARGVAEGSLDLESMELLSDEAALACLQNLRGVGRWTAEYVLLRGLGRVHVFPGDDVGARNNLQAWLGLAKSLDYDGVIRTLRRWRRYGGLLYFHLLLDRLADGGFVHIDGNMGEGKRRCL
jgi:DNA-3-methyladenine glycosylase II